MKKTLSVLWKIVLSILISMGGFAAFFVVFGLVFGDISEIPAWGIVVLLVFVVLPPVAFLTRKEKKNDTEIKKTEKTVPISIDFEVKRDNDEIVHPKTVFPAQMPIQEVKKIPPVDMIGKKTPMDFTECDEMALIKAMEKNAKITFDSWNYFSTSQNAVKAAMQSFFEIIDRSQIPLVAEIRKEQLKAEYEEKVNGLDLFAVIDSMDGHAFEEWCARLLLRNGFESAEVTKASGDQGVDVIAVKDSIKYAIQCKCYHSDLGNSPIQEVNAGKMYYGCQIGAVMTNRFFTAGAKDLASKTGTLLWDRKKIAEFMNLGRTL